MTARNPIVRTSGPFTYVKPHIFHADGRWRVRRSISYFYPLAIELVSDAFQWCERRSSADAASRVMESASLKYGRWPA